MPDIVKQFRWLKCSLSSWNTSCIIALTCSTKSPCLVGRGEFLEDKVLFNLPSLVLKDRHLGGSALWNFIGRECLSRHWVGFPYIGLGTVVEDKPSSSSYATPSVPSDYYHTPKYSTILQANSLWCALFSCRCASVVKVGVWSSSLGWWDEGADRQATVWIPWGYTDQCGSYVIIASALPV